MAYTNFSIETDADGIALITWDMPGKSMNVIDLTVMDELDALIDAVAGDDKITGAVITSGKDTFSGGADLTMLEGLLRDYHAQRAKDPEAAARLLFDGSRRLSQIFRKLEESYDQMVHPQKRRDVKKLLQTVVVRPAARMRALGQN